MRDEAGAFLRAGVRVVRAAGECGCGGLLLVLVACVLAGHAMLLATAPWRPRPRVNVVCGVRTGLLCPVVELRPDMQFHRPVHAHVNPLIRVLDP